MDMIHRPLPRSSVPLGAGRKAVLEMGQPFRRLGPFLLSPGHGCWIRNPTFSAHCLHKDHGTTLARTSAMVWRVFVSPSQIHVKILTLKVMILGDGDFRKQLDHGGGLPRKPPCHLKRQ